MDVNLIYLDSNATTPLAPQVQETITEALGNAWGNPSSSSVYGRKAKECVDTARMQTARMIGAQPQDIIFTSGGTEANHTVLHTFTQRKRGSAAGAGDQGPHGNDKPHIVTSTIEHDSIKKPLEQMLADSVAEVTFVEVDKDSHSVKVDDVMKCIQPNTVLVTVMLANNETGVIQPIRELSDGIKEYNRTSRQRVYLHADAAQAIGKIPVNVEKLAVDYLTIAGHKFYGPRIGALYVRNLGDSVSGCPLVPVFLGGGQERQYRSGTENTAMIAGLGAACQLVSDNVTAYQIHMRSLRDSLEEQLMLKFYLKVCFNGKSSLSQRLPNTCNFSVIGEMFKGREVLEKCQQVVAGVGAACHSDSTCQGSAVLIASGISEEIASNAVRLSVGRDTTPQCITKSVDDIWNAVQCLI